MNDQSALLWTEGSRVWFWGGGGEDLVFQVAVFQNPFRTTQARFCTKEWRLLNDERTTLSI